jgi:hypothetical protein
MSDKVSKTADPFPIEVAPTVADRYKLPTYLPST